MLFAAPAGVSDVSFGGWHYPVISGVITVPDNQVTPELAAAFAAAGVQIPQSGVAVGDLPLAGALAPTDVDVVNRAGVDLQTTLAARSTFFRKVAAASRTIPLTTGSTATLTATDNDRTVVVAGSSGYLALDGTITDGFRCLVINHTSGALTLTGITGLGGAGSIAAASAALVSLAASAAEAILFGSSTVVTQGSSIVSASIATTLAAGIAKPDGTTILIASDGTLSANVVSVNALTTGTPAAADKVAYYSQSGSNDLAATVATLAGTISKNLPTWTTSTRPTLAAGTYQIGINTSTTPPQFEFGYGASGSTTWIACTGSAATTSSATSFTVTVSPSSVASGSPATVTVTPGSGGWPSGEVITPSSSVAGTFSPATATGSGTTAASFTFTPSATGTASINASAPGMTSGGAVSLSVTTTAPSSATSFTVTVSPSSVASGSPATVTVTPGSGGWPSGEVITPSSSVAGTFSPATATGSGTTAASFTFTPSATGTASINASAPGMTSGGAASLTVTSPPVIAGHRYVRIDIGSNTLGSYPSVAEFAMATTRGGANILTPSTTVSASSVADTPYPASAAVDGNTSTWWNGVQQLPAWWQADLGASNPPIPVELKITARADSQTGANTAPNDFSVSMSDDGANFTVRKIYSTSGWTPGSQQTFIIPPTLTTLTFDSGTPTFETGSPIEGAASLKAGTMVASSTVMVAAAAAASAGGGNNADQGVISGGFKFKGTGTYSGSGAFMQIGPSGRALLLNMSGSTITASYGARNPAMTATPNIRDGAVHTVTYYVNSGGNTAYWGVYVDGVQIGGESSVSAFGYLPNGAQRFALDTTKMVAGDLIDQILLSNNPTAPTSLNRAADTNVIWNFNGQDGTAS